MAKTDKLDVPQGTLDLMILTILRREPLHGYGISQRLAALSGDSFRVNPGVALPVALPSRAGRQARRPSGDPRRTTARASITG